MKSILPIFLSLKSIKKHEQVIQFLKTIVTFYTTKK